MLLVTNRPPRNRLVFFAILLAAAFLALLVLWPAAKPPRPLDINPQTSGTHGTSKDLPAEPANPPELKTPTQPQETPSPSLPARRLTQRILPYGSGPEEIGLVRNPDQTPIGPESFTVATDGTIIIADRVNRRLLVYSRGGTLQRSIPTGEVNLNDVTVDNQGRIFLYDQRQLTFYQESPTGDGGFTPALRLNPADIITRGYFHIEGEKVYFADASARDVLVGVINNGTFEAPPRGAERHSSGIHATSGLIYNVMGLKGEGLRIEIHEPARTQASKQLDFQMPDLLAAQFIGEDTRGRFYAHVERLDNGRVVLEVHEFSPEGNVLRVTPLPDNDYALWTARLVQASPHGQIVQFIPGESNGKLNLLSE